MGSGMGDPDPNKGKPDRDFLPSLPRRLTFAVKLKLNADEFVPSILLPPRVLRRSDMTRACPRADSTSITAIGRPEERRRHEFQTHTHSFRREVRGKRPAVAWQAPTRPTVSSPVVSPCPEQTLAMTTSHEHQPRRSGSPQRAGLGFSRYYS